MTLDPRTKLCPAGVCHTWSDDGRCVSLLKLLLTNDCIYDCAYCINRRSNDVPRASFTSPPLVKRKNPHARRRTPADTTTITMRTVVNAEEGALTLRGCLYATGFDCSAGRSRAGCRTQTQYA